MKKQEMFQTELNYIKDERLKESAKKIIESLPDYFFIVPSNSTGKYHSKYTLGKGGLLRHTKVTVRIAHELLSNASIGEDFTDFEKDMMIIALMIHDGLKYGEPKNIHTVFEHPILIANKIRNEYQQFNLTSEEANLLASLLETHMGPWTINYKGHEVLPKPATKLQKFVHMCDYLASRKFLNVEFNDNEIIN